MGLFGKFSDEMEGWTPAPIKRDGCTPSYHEALKTTWRVGQDLTHIGVQDFGDGRRLELCNCKKCDSTLARVMRRSEMPPPPPRKEPTGLSNEELQELTQFRNRLI